MRHCKKCGIDFSGDLERCPLCQAELVGEATPAVFPKNEVRKSGTVALAVLAFATGATLLVMLFLGYLVPLPWDIVVSVCLALVLNYLFVRNIITHSPDFLRVVARYFLVLLAIAALWFLITGNLAVTTFVIPGICLVALVYDTVLVAVFKGTFVSGYAKYLLFDVALGLAPLALVALGLTTWDVLALVSALMASVFLLGLVVFMRKQLMAEMRKLFSA
ncbi:DUF6320 domain-containing protein [Eggerthella sp. YY7918]|uniref:DUF6320 domain-containing protein n=1 Tax=Eggerthella sp. (strain YY7918) TaxID=502558 RepID=UPI0002171836|nr:DUF6320 domain-containing protein [Eggerthella sp. YY7918]BAK45089.1 reverse gyrase [Eggerthella sp. YY7918]